MSSLAALAQGLLPALLMVSLRVGTALAAMPAPFGKLAPVRTRAVLGLLVSLALVLPRPGVADDVPLEMLPLGAAAFGEMLVGAVIGLTVRVTIAGAEIAGSVAGISMSLGFATSIDPVIGESSLPTTRLLSALAVLIFLVLQGHHAVLLALARSLDLAPPGHVLDMLQREGVVRIGASMMAHGLQVAAPVLATMFIVQLGTALVARAAPRVSIFALSFAVSISAGVLTLYVAAPTLATAIAVQVQHLPADLAASLGAP